MAYKGNWEQHLRDAANSAVFSAKRRKVNPLIPTPCSSCGYEKVEAHHDSYHPSKRLDVRWLCKRCHEKWHSLNKAYMPSENEL